MKRMVICLEVLFFFFIRVDTLFCYLDKYIDIRIDQQFQLFSFI